MENGLEYIMKQGAGPFYSVSDGSGNRVLSTELDAMKYTVRRSRDPEPSTRNPEPEIGN